MTYVYQPWPAWMRGPNGEAKVFQCPEDVPEGWMSVDEYRALTRALDHDGDGKPGGRLSKAEIIKDLEALEIEFDGRWSRDKLDALLRKDKAAREAAINASVK